MKRVTWRVWTRRGMLWRRYLPADEEQLLTCWQCPVYRMSKAAQRLMSINYCLISTCRLALSRSGLVCFTFRSGTDLMSLLILLLLLLFLFLFLFLLGWPLQKSLMLHHFKWDWDEILQECSSLEYPSTDGVRFATFFKLATMTPF